jgi:hypothetical protein
MPRPLRYIDRNQISESRHWSILENRKIHNNNFSPISSPIAKNLAYCYTGGFLCSMVWYHHDFALFRIFCSLSTHTKTHMRTMAHCRHHPPLSRHSASGRSFAPSPSLPPLNAHHHLYGSHCPCYCHWLPLPSLLSLPSPFLLPAPLPFSLLATLVAVAIVIAVAVAIALVALAIALLIARHSSCHCHCSCRSCHRPLCHRPHPSCRPCPCPLSRCRHCSCRHFHCPLRHSCHQSCCPCHRPICHPLTNAMATATTRTIALATTLRVTKWAMARATRAIVTNSVAAIAIVPKFG